MSVSAVRIMGRYQGATGYERHVREFTRELVRQRVAIHLSHHPGWDPKGLPAEKREMWFEGFSNPVDARNALHFAMPHQVEPVPGLVNVNYTMFESTRIPR